MILLAVGCILAVFVGGPLTVLAVLVARMQDPGRHCAAARVPAPRRPVNGRNLGTQPRRTPRPGPFTAVDMPALPADWLRVCEPDPAAVCDDIRARWDRMRADDPGLPGMRDCCLTFDNEPHWRDCEEPAPIARPWTAEQVAYGVDRCQLDVAEAERQFALALGPDGCEET